jgi:hypothetical protein
VEVPELLAEVLAEVLPLEPVPAPLVLVAEE